jgi:uncharacterized membrane protein
MRCWPQIVCVAAAVILAAAPATAGDGTVTATVHVRDAEDVGVDVVLDLDAAEAVTGERVRASATVRNLGKTRLRDVTVVLRHPSGVRVHRDGDHRIPSLRPGGERTIRWHLCADETGNYALLAQVDVPGADGSVTAESDTRILQVTGEGPRRCAGVRGLEGS